MMENNGMNRDDHKQAAAPETDHQEGWNPFRNMRLQTRLILLVLVIAVPILLIISGYTHQRANAFIRESVNKQIEQANYALYLKTTVWFDMNVGVLRQLALLPGIISMDPASQKPILEMTSQSFPHLYLVHTTDTTGIDVARNDDETNKDYSDRLWFQGPMAGQPITYQVLIGRTTNQPALAIAVPIRDDNGKTVGVASIVSHLNDITNEVLGSGELGAQAGSQTFIVDQDYQVIAHPDAVVANSLMDFSDHPAVAAMNEGVRGLYDYRDSQGTQWLAYLTRMDNGWSIITQVEAQKALVPLYAFQITSGLFTVGGLLLLIVSAALTIRRAFRPIHELTETVKAITAGDLDREAQVVRQDEIGGLAEAFNTMTRQQRQLIATLEQRVAARTRMIETSAEVSRRLSTILNLNNLVQEVVTELKNAFGYYHVHIYFFDESREELVMAGGTGKAGQAMLAQGHRIRKGVGLVGQAAVTNQPVLAGDTQQSPNYIPHPLLPETRSELSVPIAIGTQVLGVLDVQQNSANGLGEEDQQLLQSVANQVAVAVQNANAYSRAQQEAQRQEVISSIVQRIQRADSVDEVLQVALTELGRTLRAQRSSVELNVQNTVEKFL